jgi:hypothetical protein
VYAKMLETPSSHFCSVNYKVGHFMRLHTLSCNKILKKEIFYCLREANMRQQHARTSVLQDCHSLSQPPVLHTAQRQCIACGAFINPSSLFLTNTKCTSGSLLMLHCQTPPIINNHAAVNMSCAKVKKLS